MKSNELTCFESIKKFLQLIKSKLKSNNEITETNIENYVLDLSLINYYVEDPTHQPISASDYAKICYECAKRLKEEYNINTNVFLVYGKKELSLSIVAYDKSRNVGKEIYHIENIKCDEEFMFELCRYITIKLREDHSNMSTDEEDESVIQFGMGNNKLSVYMAYSKDLDIINRVSVKTKQ